jgi:hypothetical protein
LVPDWAGPAGQYAGGSIGELTVMSLLDHHPLGHEVHTTDDFSLPVGRTVAGKTPFAEPVARNSSSPPGGLDGFRPGHVQVGNGGFVPLLNVVVSGQLEENVRLSGPLVGIGMENGPLFLQMAGIRKN